MQFNEDLAAVHGYLCSDGYVVRNPEEQKHKYYHIALRNTNNILLKDFQLRFSRVFGVTPKIWNGRCIAHSKEIFETLTKYESFYSYEWKMPDFTDTTHLRVWLRAFFDCEGWVELQKAKSRAVRADCVNFSGLTGVQIGLSRLGIKSTLKKRKRNIWRINICGLDDIIKFNEEIGFLHPSKKQLLEEAIGSYKDYNWSIPKERNELLSFIKERGKLRKSRNEINLISIKKENLDKLKASLSNSGINTRVLGPWASSTGSIYYCLILKAGELRKLG